MESSTIAIIITVVSMILFFSNKLPMSVVGSITALACGLLIPEMSKSSVYSSFGGSTVIMVAGMCVVGDALFVTGIAQKLGAKVYLPELKFCGDNGAMIAAQGYYQYIAGHTAGLELNGLPTLPIDYE